MFNNWTLFEQHETWKLTPQIKTQLQTYYEFLIAENQKYNLTRITEVNEVFEKHFFDSLLFTKDIKLTNQKLLDIGSGAGFPGVVLKIFFPDLEICLVESNQKKAHFLKQVIQKLGLTKIKVVSERVEIYSKNHQEEYDFVVSRAVAYLDILLELGAQLVKVHGFFIALKGPRADLEVQNLKQKDQNLGFCLNNTQVLPDNGFGERVNLFFQKVKPTPSQYPRKYALIKKSSAINGQDQVEKQIGKIITKPTKSKI